jgi:hypothetical protein
MYSCLYYRGIIFFRDVVYSKQVRTMSGHSPEFINSEFSVSTNDADKVAAVKAALAANDHVFVFIYMDGCGHCVAAEAAWVDFTKEANNRSNAAAFAVSSAMMGSFGSALGDAPTGFPTFRCVHNGKATDYNGGRSVSDLIGWMDGTIPSQTQSGGTNKTKKNHIAKPPRISYGITSTTGARKGPNMGTATGHPTPIAQHVPPFGVGGGCRQKGGTNKTKKNTFTKPPRISYGITSTTGARKGPNMGTVPGHPTPIAQHVQPLDVGGGRRQKGSRKRRKARKTRKTHKARKTRKTRKTKRRR